MKLTPDELELLVEIVGDAYDDMEGLVQDTPSRKHEERATYEAWLARVRPLLSKLQKERGDG